MPIKQEIRACNVCQSVRFVKVKNINEHLYWLFCDKCGQDGIPKPTESAAVTEWNKNQKRSNVA
jgi:hypothetical protein